MAKKALRLITTSGDRAKSQPMIDGTECCAWFLSMTSGGVLWGKGGPPKALETDAAAMENAKALLF
jgi:hypothetical protein